MAIDVVLLNKYAQDIRDAQSSLNKLTVGYKQQDIIDYLLNEMKEMSKLNPDKPEIWAMKFNMDDGQRWFDDDMNYIEGRESIYSEHFISVDKKLDSLDEALESKTAWEYNNTYSFEALDVICMISKDIFEYGDLYLCIDGTWKFEEGDPY